MNLGLFLSIVLAAAAPAQRASGPPTTDGVYVEKGACPGEGCYMGGPLQAAAPVDVYDQPGRRGQVTGRLQAGEWVTPVETQMRLTPLRGRVRAARGQAPDLKAGDVVYLLGSQGEGCLDLWRAGKTLTWCDPSAWGEKANADIAWDRRGVGVEPDAFWVRIRRAKGSEGWIKDLDDIRCGGLQDREGCPPIKP